MVATRGRLLGRCLIIFGVTAAGESASAAQLESKQRQPGVRQCTKLLIVLWPAGLLIVLWPRDKTTHRSVYVADRTTHRPVAPRQDYSSSCLEAKLLIALLRVPTRGDPAGDESQVSALRPASSAMLDAWSLGRWDCHLPQLSGGRCSSKLHAFATRGSRYRRASTCPRHGGTLSR